MGRASPFHGKNTILMDLLSAQHAQPPHSPQVSPPILAYLFLLFFSHSKLYSYIHQNPSHKLSLERGKNGTKIALIGWEKI
jgi:hypothetical protein